MAATTRVKKILPNQAQLQELFDYDDGHLVRKHSSGGRYAGASTRDIKPNVSSGYIIIRVYGKPYVLHRVVWQWHNEEALGRRELDHINGDKTDCRYENLRIADISQNSWNAKKKCRKSGLEPASKYVGVSRSPRKNGTIRWKSVIRVRGATLSLGSNFLTEDGAYVARIAAEKKYHKEFAAHKRKEK